MFRVLIPLLALLALCAPITGGPMDWQTDTDVLIKTHERPGALDALLTSLRSHYPRCHVAVADDSQSPRPNLNADDYWLRPHDEGLSASRNYLVASTGKPFVLLLDDDMLLTDASDFQALFDALNEEQWDVVAGAVDRPIAVPPWRGRIDLAGDTLHLRPEPVPRQRQPARVLPRYHLAENFFLAKREALERCPWDPALKVGEHFDWGMRACFDADLKLTCLPEVRIFDQCLYTDRDYLLDRARAVAMRNASIDRWARRLGFRRVVNHFHPDSSYDVPANS